MTVVLYDVCTTYCVTFHYSAFKACSTYCTTAVLHTTSLLSRGNTRLPRPRERTLAQPRAVGVMHRVGARPRPFPRCARGRTRAPRLRYENRTSSPPEPPRRCRSRG